MVADSVVKTWTFLDAKEKEVEKWLKDHNLLNAFGLGSGKNMAVTPADAVRNAQDTLNNLENAGADQAAIEKAKQDLLAAEAAKKTADAQDRLKDATHALQASFAEMQYRIDKAAGRPTTPGATTPWGNFGMSDNPNETYYEHPDTEGSSSQYGPKGNKLGYGYGVGLGRSFQGKYPIGSWVKIRTANGRVIWRQVNETSARNHGVEFVTPHTDESSYGNGPSTIIDSSPTKPVTINNTFNISAMDTAGIDRVLREHGSRIAESTHRHFRDRISRSAVA